MVGFRYFTVKAARNLGLRGYVRNLRSGQVEIVAKGEENVLRELIREVSRGPAAADVRGVETDWSFFTEEKFENFDART